MELVWFYDMRLYEWTKIRNENDKCKDIVKKKKKECLKVNVTKENS